MMTKSKTYPLQEAYEDTISRIHSIYLSFGVVGIVLGILSGCLLYIGKGESFLFWMLITATFSSVIVAGVLKFLGVVK